MGGQIVVDRGAGVTTYVRGLAAGVYSGGAGGTRAVAGRKGKDMILLVEDSWKVAELIRSALQETSVSEPMMVKQTGEEALAYFKGDGEYANRRSHPLPKLVLLDLGLPGVHGLDVLTWLRCDERFMSLPVVVLSEERFRGDIESAYRMGANSVVMKGQKPEELARDVQEVARYWFGVCELPRVAANGAREADGVGIRELEVGI